MKLRLLPGLSVAAWLVSGAVVPAAAQEPQVRPYHEAANGGKPWVRAGNGGPESENGLLPGAYLLDAGKPRPEDRDRGWTWRLINLGKPPREDSDERPLPVILPPLVKVGIGGSVAHFPNLESTACDPSGITACEVDDWSIGPVIFVEVNPLRAPISVGLRGGYASVSVDQSYTGPELPLASTVELDVWTATLYARGRLRLAEGTSAFGTVGAVWAWNRATVTSVHEARTLREERSESGLRMAIGAGFEQRIAPRTCLRLEYRFIDGDAGDADRQHEIGLSVGYGLVP